MTGWIKMLGKLKIQASRSAIWLFRIAVIILIICVCSGLLVKIGKTAIQACNFIWEAVTWILYPAGVWLFNCASEPFYVWNWFFDEVLAEQSQKAVEGFGEHHDYSSNYHDSELPSSSATDSEFVGREFEETSSAYQYMVRECNKFMFEYMLGKVGGPSLLDWTVKGAAAIFGASSLIRLSSSTKFKSITA